uniref:Dirigent protein n=1 Tax=Leersia perrieri TaxID=77586 RepID=A0A0D9XPN5_9ORYZ
MATSNYMLAAAALLIVLAAATPSPATAKETRLRVFWHDVVSGPNSTVTQVAESPISNTSATGFGTVIVIDDPLTAGPNLTTSKLIGRAQGMYVSAGKDTLSLMMAMSFVFVDGSEYNGSSLAVFGPNPAERQVREMAVVGGTGVFRFARGYAQARTRWFNASTGDATVEYNIHLIWHNKVVPYRKGATTAGEGLADDNDDERKGGGWIGRERRRLGRWGRTSSGGEPAGTTTGSIEMEVEMMPCSDGGGYNDWRRQRWRHIPVVTTWPSSPLNLPVMMGEGVASPEAREGVESSNNGEGSPRSRANSARGGGDRDGAGMTKFKVFFHDVLAGPNATAIRIAQAPSTNNSTTSFGAVVAIDDPLTSGPSRANSTELGRAQGSYTFTDQKVISFLMSMNLVFTAGDHKGSTLDIMGRNEVASAVREMSIVGGSGKFRMAKGYVEARTVDYGLKSGESVVEYTIFVKASSAAALPLQLLLLLSMAAAMALAADDAAGLTKFKLYWHDVLAGSSPTAIRVAQAPSTNASSTFFGAVVAIDDPLTSGPSRASSTELGRAQGSYTFADQKTFGLLMNMNFVFTAGDNKGSTLTIVGRNEVLSAVREMSIVGGSGKFRMAKGYVEARTIDSGNTSGETVVEYTVFMSIVGGSGKFRMAKGYVEARTVDSGNNAGETTVEYTVFVKTP